jgi:hypothetical protein
MVLMIVTLTAGLMAFSSLRQRITPVLLVLLGITALGGISTAYALSGKFALQGFLFLMTALCSTMLLSLLPDRGMTGRSMATALAGAAALISLLSIDHVSTRLLSTPVLSLFGYEGVTGVEEQVRLTSIFEMPNVFAGCAGLGSLLSLGLAMSAADRKERKLDLVLLYVNTLGFLLAFSMGATASAAVALLVYLLLQPRQQRWDLAVLTGLTLLTVLPGMLPISVTSLGSWEGIRPIGPAVLISGAAVLCAADHYLTERLAGKLKNSGKKAVLFSGILAALLIGFGITACLWTGGATLEQGESLRRAVYPGAGSYTLTASGSGEIAVTVESQNRQEAMMHSSTVLYSGSLQNAAFTVPQDTLVVYLSFTADTEGTLERVTFEGAEGSGSVPLRYKLLPGFVANRLQGFFANQNAIQRLVFFRDGLKLFAERPLFGQGLGAFESALYRVQGFHYETKYVHNHYIQTMLETGIVGLLLFVGLLVLAGITILRAGKKPHAHPLIPALGALLVYMAVHASVEVVFSSGFYLPLAFGVFALMGLCCPESLPKKVSVGTVAASGALLLTFTVLLGCNLRAAQIGHQAVTLADFQKAADLDPFEWTDYAVSYVVNAPAHASSEVLEQAERYVNQLDREQTNTIHYQLSRYCFETGQVQRGMEMALKQAKNTLSDSGQWNRLFVMLSQYDDGSESYRAGIRALGDLMDQWNRENPGQIVLEDAVQSFVDHRTR